MNLGRFMRDVRYRIFYGLLLDHRFPISLMGNTVTECAWHFHAAGLGPDSIVYSGGVGNDITFEHELVRNFGCQIVLFDPSPTGLATMARPENQIPQFRFCPVALAGHSGELSLAPPPNPEEGSWFAKEGGSETVKVPCTDLASLMRRNGHDRIDLLKLDIEGSELEVIDDMLARRIPVRQLCVEFHHGILPAFKRSQSIRAILRLRMRGYRLLDQHGNNHTFLWAGKWP